MLLYGYVHTSCLCPTFWLWIAHFASGLTNWENWIELSILIIFNLGLSLLIAFFIAPLAAMIGSFFIDNAAAIIEKEDYPNEPTGQAMSCGYSFIFAFKFLILSLFGNGIAFFLFFIPNINLIAFYIINGYLFVHEYFLFAAYRFRSKQEAHVFLHTHHTTVFCAGLLIAFFVSIPILNLVTPLFAAAFMTHLHKMLSSTPDSITVTLK